MSETSTLFIVFVAVAIGAFAAYQVRKRRSP
jgi:hypothetical protein